MDKHKALDGRRLRRKYRVRNKIKGSATKPRMSVNRSLANLSVQLIDDASGKTIVSASTQEKSLRSNGYGGNCKAAQQLGTVIAERATQAGIKQVAFDRGASRYHGRLAALADAARAGGLEF
jgi:large subunit ribosomal protein L18